MQVEANGIRIEYEREGDSNAPPLVLVMGMGAQLIRWPRGFCELLLARGLQLIRFDNRDAGLSTHLSGTPNLQAVLAGDLSSVSYTLSDMAKDTVGLLDALEIERAHLAGASLGGAVAQTMAIEHPERVRSLTSIMSTTGDRSVGQTNPDTLRKLFSGAAASTREEAIEQVVRFARVVGSPGFDEAALRDIAARSFDRAHDPQGFVRQSAAMVASGDRTAKLRSLSIPTLVIHGANDLLIDVSGGRATAAAIPNAELLIFEGMGHDLPAARWAEITSRIDRLVRRSIS